jgi:hypothetical protein
MFSSNFTLPGSNSLTIIIIKRAFNYFLQQFSIIKEMFANKTLMEYIEEPPNKQPHAQRQSFIAPFLGNTAKHVRLSA